MKKLQRDAIALAYDEAGSGAPLDFAITEFQGRKMQPVLARALGSSGAAKGVGTRSGSSVVRIRCAKNFGARPESDGLRSYVNGGPKHS